jgi:hypothetical protein
MSYGLMWSTSTGALQTTKTSAGRQEALVWGGSRGPRLTARCSVLVDLAPERQACKYRVAAVFTPIDSSSATRVE